MQPGLSKILRSAIWPLFFILIMWAIKIWEVTQHEFLISYGVNPREIDGLKGIFFSPFIHGDFIHLTSNSIPFLILGTSLVYFYRSIALRSFLIIWFMGGFWLWLAGRVSFHIGASGWVYGLVFFLFLSGLFRKERQLMAFSLLIAFLYGGLVWGMLPIDTGMSWEGHVFGSLAGILAAVIYRGRGPQRKQYSWEIDPSSDDIWYPEMDEENADSESSPLKSTTTDKPTNVVYHYKKSDNPDSK